MTKTGLSKHVIYKYCKYCQTRFKVKDRPTSDYCCEEHQKLAKMAKKSEQVLNRPYTADTKFLIQKWHSEGTSISTICDILHRSRDNVTACLKGAENKC
jgi:hypothetical protein